MNISFQLHKMQLIIKAAIYCTVIGISNIKADWSFGNLLYLRAKPECIVPDEYLLIY